MTYWDREYPRGYSVPVAYRALAAIARGILRLLGVVLMCGCALTPAQRAGVALVGLGSATTELIRASDRQFVAESQAIVEVLRASGGSVDDYRERARPATELHARRAVALAGFAGLVWASARAVDASALAGGADWIGAVHGLLDGFTELLRALGSPGGDVPPVPVPAAVIGAVELLRALVMAMEVSNGHR